MVSSNRVPFHGGLYGLSQFVICVAIIPGFPTYARWLAIAFASYLSYYLIFFTTTGDLPIDLALGSAILTQIFVAVDLILLTNPTNLKNLEDKEPGLITDKSLFKRIIWTFNLFTNPRGIGWAHEPAHLPKRPSPSTSRVQFVIRRLITAIVCAVLEGVMYLINASNPGMTTKGKLLSESPLIWRALGVGGFALAGFGRINAMNCILSAMVVGTGFSTPARWPNLFGSPFEAWSIQHVWRRVWHQLLRQPVTSSTHFILVNVFRCQIQPNLSVPVKIIRLYTAFTIVGFIHIGGEYMLLGKMGWGAFKFFVLQAVGITLESIVQHLWAGPQSSRREHSNGHAELNGSVSKGKFQAPKLSHPRLWTRCVGYVWVAAWFTWTLAFMIDPMVTTGFFDDPRVDLRTRLSETWIPIG